MLRKRGLGQSSSCEEKQKAYSKCKITESTESLVATIFLRFYDKCVVCLA